MAIRIRCDDKMSASTQQLDISMVKTETMHFHRRVIRHLKRCLGCYADTYKQFRPREIQDAGKGGRSMIRRSGRTGLLATRWGFPRQAMALCIAAILPIATAEAQVWVGSCVGLDSPVSAISDQRRSNEFGGLGRGVDIGFQVAKRWQVDLFITGYTSGLVGGNDADPYYYLSLGARRRWLLGDPAGFLLPFASAGFGVGLAEYVQGELGIDFAPNRSVGFELGIRERVGFPVVQSAQAYFLLRIGRIAPPTLAGGSTSRPMAQALVASAYSCRPNPRVKLTAGIPRH